ncbi:hypothetical protein KFK09_020932 [Dendrobium nobile]|uniref:Viral late gene transcription factor 3 zinc ribbon domain-containing protein n=1 Tax=Dendrobium nobile TaxID=94219 RepID=A0A8T3AMR0_DENNO|nr:hypothetical protein KFK09_020930 [Dendrobium nobile]KAI0497699.1 hypothetical protein KFK09_020932 [Dendrobium nobile]
MPSGSPSLMEASSFPMPLVSSRPQILSWNLSANPNRPLHLRGRGWINRRISLIRAPPICAMDGGTASNLAPVEISWQIAVGAIAGATPFIVAGIEFGKRIVAQGKCGTCGGSGLVLRDEYYSRCPTCGGFLPWQSWKRFFTG